MITVNRIMLSSYVVLEGAWTLLGPDYFEEYLNYFWKLAKYMVESPDIDFDEFNCESF